MSIYRFPDPPELRSLSPADTAAYRRWAAELNATLNRMASQMGGAANGAPFWAVSVSTYPTRSLAPTATTDDVRNALGTLLVDLKAKGVIG